MSLKECLRQANELSDYIMGSNKPVRDAVYMHQCGRVPRITFEEIKAGMSEDELHAIEIIGQMGQEYEGLFADFPQPEPRKKARPEAPPEPKEMPPKPPKVSKKCLAEAKALASCIESLTTTKTEEIVKAASAICLCGGTK